MGGASARTTLAMIMGLFLLLGAGILAGRLHHQAAPRTLTVGSGTGTLTITGTITSAVTTPGCASAPNVVHAGATVVILDPNGAVLATTRLGSGRAVAGGACAWSYRVAVPSTDAYQVQVAGVPPVSVTRAQLQRSKGSFHQPDPQPSTGGSPVDSGL